MNTKSRFTNRFGKAVTQAEETVTSQFAPRTDIHPEELAHKPWLRFYQEDVQLEPPSGNSTLPGLLRATATKYPDQTCLSYFGNMLSYKEVDEAADRFAKGLDDI